MAYSGSIDLIAGIRPKNNQTFPLVNAVDVYVDDDTRLDAALAKRMPFYPFASLALASGAVTLSPFANNALDLSQSDVTAFSVSAGASAVSGAMRDMWFVLKTGPYSPTITWDQAFDRFVGGSAAEVAPDIDSTNIYWIFEYESGKFSVEKQGYQGGGGGGGSAGELVPVYRDGKLVSYVLGDQSDKPLQPAGSYASTSEMSVTPGTGNSADKTTIQLQSGVSAEVLVGHLSGTSAHWRSNENRGFVPALGQIVIWTDHDTTTLDGQTVDVPGVKIGDGMAYNVDLPFTDSALAARLTALIASHNEHVADDVAHITAAERASWNHKITTSDTVSGDTLVLTRN